MNNIKIPLDIFTKKYVKNEALEFVRKLGIIPKHNTVYYDEGTVKLIIRDPARIKPRITATSSYMIVDTNEYLQSYFYTQKNYSIMNPVLLINNTPVMSLTPLEIESQYLPIEYAYGDVLVLGLGLGYYIQKIKDKENVNEITVVEKNSDVIKFYNHFFKEDSKIKIVNADAREIEDYRADFCFNDIYSVALSFDDIVRDFVIINSSNYLDNYFAWTQEALLFGLLTSQDKPVFSIPYMKPFERWLMQGAPFLHAIYEFRRKSANSQRISFDRISVHHSEFPKFLTKFPIEKWMSLY